jgi:hypothetical protein
MGELVVPEADNHSGSACHACVYGIMPHQQAEGRVVWVRLLTPDHVTGVYVLKVDLHAGPLEMFLNAVTEQDPDVPVFDVARGVPFARCCEEFLASV